jgi:ABC-type maltose transport system permease subunit
MILVIVPQCCNCWPSISRYNTVLWLLEFSMQPHCILLVGVYTLASKFQGPNTYKDLVLITVMMPVIGMFVVVETCAIK